MKHLKRYNSLIFESVTKDIGDNDIEEKIKRISDYIHRFPQEKDRMLSELENIKRGLRAKNGSVKQNTTIPIRYGNITTKVLQEKIWKS